MDNLKLKGRQLLREDGSVFAVIVGWRPKDSRKAHNYTRCGYRIEYDLGERETGYSHFADAVKAARSRYARWGDLPSTN